MTGSVVRSASLRGGTSGQLSAATRSAPDEEGAGRRRLGVEPDLAVRVVLDEERLAPGEHRAHLLAPPRRVAGAARVLEGGREVHELRAPPQRGGERARIHA